MSSHGVRISAGFAIVLLTTTGMKLLLLLLIPCAFCRRGAADGLISTRNKGGGKTSNDIWRGLPKKGRSKRARTKNNGYLREKMQNIEEELWELKGFVNEQLKSCSCKTSEPTSLKVDQHSDNTNAKICKTKDGETCEFPFYHRKWHNSCTSVGTYQNKSVCGYVSMVGVCIFLQLYFDFMSGAKKKVWRV